MFKIVFIFALFYPKSKTNYNKMTQHTIHMMMTSGMGQVGYLSLTSMMMTPLG